MYDNVIKGVEVLTLTATGNDCDIPTTTSHTNYMYTGQEREGTTAGEMYYYGARYYDPGLGRFISPDPLVSELNFAGIGTTDDGKQRKQKTSAGLVDPKDYVIRNEGSWYAYCGNNPIRYTDPTGLFELVLPWTSVTPLPTWITPGYIYPSAPLDYMDDLNTPDYSKPGRYSDDIDWHYPPNGPDNLGPNWEEDPNNQKDKTGKHKRYINKKTGEKIRWDEDHWHRENPNKTGSKDYNLDKNGNPTAKWKENAHLKPKSPTPLDKFFDWLCGEGEYKNDNEPFNPDADGDGIPDPI
jgi:RHS repeat-associated protein